jgi:hypothetical protein
VEAAIAALGPVLAADGIVAGVPAQAQPSGLVSAD